MSIALPEKYFYTIGDVCKLTGIKPHVLRYWESQFKFLRPARRYSGHRKYTKRDIDLISRIKHLVLEKRYTLAGARREIGRQFSSRPQIGEANQPKVSAVAVLQEIRNDIESCIALLGPEEKQQELLDFK